MTHTNFTSSISGSKPAKLKKPYPEFPLAANGNGQWSKKIRGCVHYIGKWDEPDLALNRCLDQKDALHTGRKPRPGSDELTVKELCNAFLNAKAELIALSELTNRTWEDYKEMCALLIDQFSKSRVVCDLMPVDFAELRNRMAKRWSATTLGNRINRIRVVSSYVASNALIDKPVPFGQGFKRPSRKTIRDLQRRQSAPPVRHRQKTPDLPRRTQTRPPAGITKP